MLHEILLCALLAAILLVLSGGLWAWCLLPLKGRGLRVLLSASGDGKELEHQCRGYLFLLRLGCLQGPLLLVDQGLNDEGRKLAKKLADSDERIRFCEESEWYRLLDHGE